MRRHGRYVVPVAGKESAAAAASRSVGDDHLEALVLPARRGRDADGQAQYMSALADLLAALAG
jgi:hypothetical protein